MARLGEILQIGFLSMFFAEILTASSAFWFLNPWGWFVTYPLYLVHTVFLFNIGKRLKLKKISQYYLLGTIFGLYESWITKVLWSGYGSGMRKAILGEYWGIAIFEFSILVFFYHPIFSFLLPLVSYQILEKFNEGNSIFTISMNYTPSRKGILFLILCFFFSTSLFVNNNQFNLVNMTGSLFGSLLLIFVMNRILKRKDNPYNQSHLIVGRRGMMVMSAYLILLYSVTFVFLEPQYIPEIQGYIPILIAYLIPIIVLAIVKIKNPVEIPENTRSFTSKTLKLVIIAYLLMVIVFTLIPGITIIVATAAQIICLVLGPILYILMIISSLSRKISSE